MGKFFDNLQAEHISFIEEQKIFFIGTSSDGKGVNISPKGIYPLKIVDSKTALFIDFYGSGNRTAEDITEGSSVTIMFNSFVEKPLIIRLFCGGRIVLSGDPDFDDKAGLWGKISLKRVRQIFEFNIERVQVSCGFGVPLYRYEGERREHKSLTGQ